MQFDIKPIRKLYKEYYRLYIKTDEPKYNTHIDIEPNEFKNLYLQIKERVEMDGINVID